MRSNACLLCFFIFLGTVSDLFAFKKGSIRGKVTDKNTGQSVVGANILVLNSKNKPVAQTNTDENGTFVLENLEPNTYNVECRINMYRTQQLVGLFIKESSTRLAYMRLTYKGNSALEDTGNKKIKEDIEYVYTYASIQAKQQAETSLATGKNEKLEDIPATGYLLSAEDIQVRGYLSLLDVLQDIPEIEIQEKVGGMARNIISSRGMAGNGRLMIKQDGVRLNSMMGTDVVIAGNIPIAHAKSIEIIIGPVSALYGADAYIGIININTYKKQESKSIGLAGGYGMYSTLENRGHIGWGDAQKSVVAGFNYYRSQEPNLPQYYPSDYDWYHNAYSQTGAMLHGTERDTIWVDSIRPYSASTYDLSAFVKANFKNWEAGYTHNQANHNSSLGQMPEYAIHNNQFRTHSFLDNAYLKYEYNTEKWSSRTHVQFSSYRHMPSSSYMDDFTRYQNGYRYGGENSIFSKSLNSLRLNEQHTFAFGGSIQYSSSVAITNYTPKISDFQISFPMHFIGVDSIFQSFTKETRMVGGLFAQHQWIVNPKLTILAGGRLDIIHVAHNFSNQSDIYTPFNPRVGVVYKPNNAFRLKLFAGSASLTTSPQKTFLEYGHIDTVVNGIPHTDFWRGVSTDKNNTNRPESLKTLEFSSSYTRSNLIVSFNAYGNYYQRLYEVILDTTGRLMELPHATQNGADSIYADLVARPTKEGKGYSYGGTVSAVYTILDDKKNNYEFKINAAYSFLNGLHTNYGAWSDLHYAAKHTIKAGLTFKYKKLSAYATLLFRSSSQNDAFSKTHVDVASPAFVTMNLFANYRLFESQKHAFRLNIFLRVRNLTDAQYYHLGKGGDYTRMALVPQDPIRILGGISLSFF